MALSCKSASEKLLYRLNTSIVLCPLIFMMVRWSIPARRILLRAVCRKSWNRNPSIPALRHAALKAVLVDCKGFPASPRNTCSSWSRLTLYLQRNRAVNSGVMGIILPSLVLVSSAFSLTNPFLKSTRSHLNPRISPRRIPV